MDSDRQGNNELPENKITGANNTYSLWRANYCQQGFRSEASSGFSGQESASKPPQAICKPLMPTETREQRIAIFRSNNFKVFDK